MNVCGGGRGGVPSGRSLDKPRLLIFPPALERTEETSECLLFWCPRNVCNLVLTPHLHNTFPSFSMFDF